MKKSTKLKALVLSLAMALGMLSPATVLAQGDDFFRDGGGYTDRAGSGGYAISSQTFGLNSYIISNQTFGLNSYDITNQTFGDEAPLGSGLLILTAVGAGYAAVRRKR